MDEDRYISYFEDFDSDGPDSRIYEMNIEKPQDKERISSRKAAVDYTLVMGSRDFHEIVMEVFDVIASTHVDEKYRVNIWVSDLGLELSLNKDDTGLDYTQYDIFKVAYGIAVALVLDYGASQNYKDELKKWLATFNYQGYPFDFGAFRSLDELKEGGN